MAFVLSDFRDEFDNYAMSQTAAGRMTYSAPEGDHDDIVSAKMLQHWGVATEGIPEASILSPSEPSNGPSDPMDEDDAEWADLLDEETDDERQAAYEVGLEDFAKRPTPEELLLRPDVFF
jgi:hypothetical protein